MDLAVYTNTRMHANCEDNSPMRIQLTKCWIFCKHLQLKQTRNNTKVLPIINHWNDYNSSSSEPKELIISISSKSSSFRVTTNRVSPSIDQHSIRKFTGSQFCLHFGIFILIFYTNCPCFPISARQTARRGE